MNSCKLLSERNQCSPITRLIKPGQRYRHFKGDLYEVITTALHSENYCPLVVYKNLATGVVYARPYDLFCGKKDRIPKSHCQPFRISRRRARPGLIPLHRHTFVA